jgi:hypothetical protein
MQTATTADYTFLLYAEDRAFTPAPGLEFTVASWSINYRAQDSILPGVVPSQMDLTVFGGFNIADYRTMLADAKGRYIIEMKQGLDVIWRGFLIPDVSSIELLNGQRFVKLVFSDGFQMLDRRADFYQYTGTVSFTEQIWYAFENCNLFDAYDYFLVSEHRQPTNKTITGDYGGLWWTGCIQEGFWTLNGEYRTYLEVINDICVTFNLQLFQDKGQLVFRSLEYKTPAWYNVYGIYGAFVSRITPPATTLTPVVYSDGNELYKPAAREVFIRHNKPSQGIIRDESTTYKSREDYFVSNVIPTGANHIDYDANLRMRLSFSGSFPGGAISVEWYVTVQFGNYFWDGSDWVTTPSYLTYSDSRIVGPGPSIEDLANSFSIHTDPLPQIGTEPLYVTIEGTQTSGYPADTISITSTLYFAYHNDNPTSTLYYADNTGKVNGVTQSLDTEVGDIWQNTATLPALPGEIRCFTTTARTTAYGNIFWDADQNLLIERAAYQLARKNYRPKQYYEIELDGVVRYNHTFNWGGVDYKPVNLQIGERSTSVTYAEWVDGNLETDPNSKRPDQFL